MRKFPVRQSPASGSEWLRDEAENRLQGSEPQPASPADRLLHELQVHQIELEMQNETLMQTQAALEESRDRYVNLFDFAPVGYLTLNEAGMIVEANLTGARLLGVERKRLLQSRFGLFVEPGEVARWNDAFIGVLRREDRSQLELTLKRADGSRWQAHIDCLREESDSTAVRMALSDITERVTLERALAKSHEQIKELSKRAVNAQEEARRRLCAELHDRTSPNLAAMKINLDVLAALAPEDVAKRAERIEDTDALLIDTHASIREIAYDLRPPLLDYAGLASAVRGYASQFSKRTGIAVNVDCEPAAPRLEPRIESLLFRIFQEAMTNCAKHADATSIDVTLRLAERPIALTIADDGKGFDLDARKLDGAGGFGLISMRELAELAGARFAIDSQPGMGTTLAVEL